MKEVYVVQQDVYNPAKHKQVTNKCEFKTEKEAKEYADDIQGRVQIYKLIKGKG